MFDLIIKNGRIIDGSGKSPYFSDIGISDGKIVKIDSSISDGNIIIDAKNLMVTPGFIDSHSHSDSTIESYPLQREKAEQGITTSIGGMCGQSKYPMSKENESGDKYVLMGEFLKRSENLPQGSNIALTVGHSCLRKAVMGMDIREPEKAELEEMKALLREALDNGAIGMSFGLIYTPSCYAKTDELIELAKVVKEYDGVVAAHIRNEADFLEEAVSEFIGIIKASGVRGVVSHHKAMYKKNHGKVVNTLEMIKKANEEGFEIYCDVYPYIASSTTLEARFIPSELRKGGDKVVEALNDEKICADIKKLNLEKWGDNLDWVMIVTCKGYPEYEGLTLDKIAEIHGKDVYETIFDILRNSGGTADASYFAMCEEDVERVMAYPGTMIGTDSSVEQEGKVYHPRLRGSFPRTLGRYVRERKVTALEEMIRKMTSLPASVYKLKNKGLIKEGYDADICIFDAEKIIDRADFTDCRRRCEGLNYVIVNGEIVVKDAVANGKMPGRVMMNR